MTTVSIVDLSDRELLERTARVASDERRTTAELLALIGELDARRLYLAEGYSSLFSYCTQALHLAEHAAYHRIEAARAARRFPVILKLVADGSITLTTIALLRQVLTSENHEALLTAARHRSKREIEYQVACLEPKPDVKTVIRKLAAVRESDATTAQASRQVEDSESSSGPTFATVALALEAVPLEVGPRPTVAPLASDRYLLRVTLSAATHAKLRRAQQLMSHTMPDGDPASVIDKALSLLVIDLERAKLASVRRPRTTSATRQSPSAAGSRYIPAAIRREVWARDDGRCAFVGVQGRCNDTQRLEFHHVVPFARGGPTSVGNLALRCRAHNRHEGERAFGRLVSHDAHRPGDAAQP